MGGVCFSPFPATAAARIRQPQGPLSRCFGRRGDRLSWHTDLKPHALGDFSIAVVQANSSLEDQAQVLTYPSATYVGVYDGHGGPKASRFINNRLFLHIHRLSLEQGGLSANVIRKAFDATEEEFFHLVKRSWPTRPHIASVGSCCLVGAITDDVLYVANLGDSRVVLGRKVAKGRSQPVVAEWLSSDHNVAEEEVRKELEAMYPDDSHIFVGFARNESDVCGPPGDERARSDDCALPHLTYGLFPLFEICNWVLARILHL